MRRSQQPFVPSWLVKLLMAMLDFSRLGLQVSQGRWADKVSPLSGVTYATVVSMLLAGGIALALALLTLEGCCDVHGVAGSIGPQGPTGITGQGTNGTCALCSTVLDAKRFL